MPYIAHAVEYLETPLGPMRISATDRGLTEARFVEGAGLNELPAGNSVTAAAVSQLREYFAGNRRTFDLPLAAVGTAFRQQVWQALQKIPYGQTCSYRDIAQVIGNPKAVRAVGTSNGSNPIAIIVPCHRVVGADGRLTGYAGGLERKQWLLDLENCSP